MNQQLLRSDNHLNHDKLTARERRKLWKITTNISDERQQEIEKYLRNAERGRLRMEHDGADVSRPLTQEQIDKFLKCHQCCSDPKVYICFKKNQVGVCERHWNSLAEIVIGWGEAT